MYGSDGGDGDSDGDGRQAAVFANDSQEFMKATKRQSMATQRQAKSENM